MDIASRTAGSVDDLTGTKSAPFVGDVRVEHRRNKGLSFRQLDRMLGIWRDTVYGTF